MDALVVFGLILAFTGALVGPCLCAPRPDETSAGHACCGTAAGLRPAAPECCSCVTAAASPVAMLSGSATLLALAPAVEAPIPRVPSMPAGVAALVRAPHQASPPLVPLRI